MLSLLYKITNSPLLKGVYSLFEFEDVVQMVTSKFRIAHILLSLEIFESGYSPLFQLVNIPINRPKSI